MRGGSSRESLELSASSAGPSLSASSSSIADARDCLG